MANLSLGPGVSVDFLDIEDSGIAVPTPSSRTSTRYVVDYGDGSYEEFVGFGFTYASNGFPTGGTITKMTAYDGGDVILQISDVSLSASVLMGYYRAGADLQAQSYIFAGADHMVGGADADTMRGFTGNDYMEGNGGNDVLYGDAGDDIIDGGAGVDTAGYDAAVANFAITQSGANWIVADKRPNGLGTDTLISIERIAFTDRIVNLQISNTLINTEAGNILRSSAVTDISILVANSLKTTTEGLADLIKRADATTTVATLSYQFFTGKIPTKAGYDFLISPTGGNGANLNSAYYAQFDTINRYINFAVNLGRNGEGKDAFLASYGALSLFDATKKAYGVIFGATPSDAKVHALIDTRVDYLAYYGGDGANGIGTKAAMVGFLLAAAATEDVGMYSKASNDFLTDLADGATFAVDLVGVYGKGAYAYAG